jgi:hypothetical protein
MIRPVSSFESLSYYPQLCERVRELASQGLNSRLIAQRLDAEGYRSPKLVEGFGHQGVQKLMRRLSLRQREGSQQPSQGLLGEHEWWLGELIEGNAGDDILRGQVGSEHLGTTQPTMFGDQGDDKIFGGPGEDGLQGDEGTDEHYGGDNNDFINAAAQDSPEDPRDLVDCGGGNDDTAVRRPRDIVRNCEQVIDSMDTPVAPALVTTNEEQQQQSEVFLSGNG